MRKVLAIDTPTLLALTKIAPTTLNYWVGKGFCEPSLDVGSGRRATRYWTIRDVLVVRAVKSLRDAGCSLANVAKVKDILEGTLQKSLGSAVLVYDGRDVQLLEKGAAMSLLKNRGQALFVETLVTVSLPLGRWMRETRASARPIDVEEIRKRREDIWLSRGIA